MFNAKNIQAGESLAGDLLKIMGETKTALNTYYTASIESAKRVALDKSLELSKYSVDRINAIQDKEDPDELALARDDIGKKFSQLSQIKFELEEAQQAFDDMFVKSKAPQVAQTQASLRDDEIKYRKKRLSAEVLQRVDSQYSSGYILTKDEVDTEVKILSDGKVYNKAEAQYKIADRNTTHFESFYTNSTKKFLDRYDASEMFAKNGTLDKSTYAKIFNKEFGAWGKMDPKTGEIRFNKDVDNKAKEEILRSWSGFKRFTKQTSTSNLDPFKRIKKDISSVTSKLNSEYIPTQNLLEDRKKYENEITKLSDKPHTESQLDSAMIELERYNNAIKVNYKVEELVNSATEDQLIEYLNNGYITEFKSSLSGVSSNIKISPNKFKSYIKHQLKTLSDQAESIDMSDIDNEYQFINIVESIKKYESASNIESDISKKYNNLTESGSYSTLKDSNDVKKLYAYNQVVISNVKDNEHLRNLNNKIKSTIVRKDIDDKQKVNNVNVILQASKSKKDIDKENLYVRKKVNDFVKEQREGEGYFTLAANITVETENAIVDYVIHRGLVDNPDEALSEIEDRLFDVGSFIPLYNEDFRAVLPAGISEKIAKNAMLETLNEYNKENATDFDLADVIISNKFKNGDFTIVVKRRDDGTIIGEIDRKKAYILNAKGEIRWLILN